MLITSKDNNKIKEVRKLLDKKYSFEHKLFVIEGDNLIIEAIKNNMLVSMFVLDGNNPSYGFEYDTVSEEVMKSMSDLKSTPRVIGVSKFIDKNDLGNKIVILDDVQDPGNLGTIIRSSVAFGVDTIVLSKKSVSPYNSKVLRSTGGMIYNLNIIVDDINILINKIKSNNIKVIGTSLHTNNSLETLEKINDFAIILGNEGNGVSEEALSLCDEVIKINMNPLCESLNVSVSASLILYHLWSKI